MFRYRQSQLLVLEAVLLCFCTQMHAAEVELPSSLKTCAAIKRNAERLACYDRAIEQLSASDSGQAALPQVSAESMFGINYEANPPASNAPDRTEITSISSQLRSTRVAGGAIIIELENGQIWRQERNIDLSVKPGDEVTISRAALGAFKLSTPNGRYVRVSRVK